MGKPGTRWLRELLDAIGDGMPNVPGVSVPVDIVSLASPDALDVSGRTGDTRPPA